MIPKKRFKLKAIIIGFFLVKISITVFYLAGVHLVTEGIFHPKTAVAQGKGDMDPSAQAASVASKSEPDAKKNPTHKEIQAIMDQLEQKRNRLKVEAEQIKKERNQLEGLKADIEVRLEKLVVVQKNIDDGLVKKAEMEAQAKRQNDAKEAAKIKQLVKVYTSMNPKKAAEIIDKMNMTVVHQVFSNMKGEQIGKILANVNRERAAQITERLAAKDTI